MGWVHQYIYRARLWLASHQIIFQFLLAALAITSTQKSTTMKYFIILSALIVAISAQRLVQPEVYAPIPYSFSYNAPTEDGGNSAREETGDGNGRVQGSYTVQGEGGFGRVVNYVADENGFRASIQTNEPGTANQNPADVVIESTAETQPISPIRTAPIAPITRPVVPGNSRAGVRYVLVPITDPRAQGYY